MSNLADMGSNRNVHTFLLGMFSLISVKTQVVISPFGGLVAASKDTGVKI